MSIFLALSSVANSLIGSIILSSPVLGRHLTETYIFARSGLRSIIVGSFIPRLSIISLLYALFAVAVKAKIGACGNNEARALKFAYAGRNSFLKHK